VESNLLVNCLLLAFLAASISALLKRIAK